MAAPAVAKWLLEQEARALLTRLARLRPFSLHTPMVAAASISPAAQSAIETHMIRMRQKLRRLVHDFLNWLRQPAGLGASPAEAQRRFTLLRLRFNSVISQFDIFADVLTQRTEHETGVWIAGLDDVASDALALPGGYYDAPPLVCYLDRGAGAAIRRARTRLPGGEESPVGIIRVPRERMIGTGISSSLVHEVGHQGSALLDLANSLRPVLRGMQRSGGPQQVAWQLWERWISEVLADFWSVAKLGIAATMGLIGVVSVPRAFVFRVDLEDPHPFPWVRVRLSCAMGYALYPHPQWAELAKVWQSLYPLLGLDEPRRRLLGVLEATMPGFVSLLVHHRPRALRGKSLMEAMPTDDRHPARLAAYYRAWGASPTRMREAPPTLAFAVIGQARADGKMTPEEESGLLARLLTYWAVRSALDASAVHAARPAMRLRNRAQSHVGRIP